MEEKGFRLDKDIELSVVIPCLNEEGTVKICIEKALRAFDELNIDGEVVIVDNGSVDRSVEVAEKAGARVVYQDIKGYGSALKKGFAEARGKYIIMGDADATYDFSDIGKFVNLLEKGAEFVMGSRFRGKIYPNAMPWSHKYIGTPLLTSAINTFFKSKISDVNCGMRGFRKELIKKLDLKSNGMEFASEMIIKAAAKNLAIDETPINLYPSPCERTPHLSSFRDGWRHLRFMLIFCPRYLFLYPGLFLLLLGAMFMLLFFFRTEIFHVPVGLSTAVLANALLLMGMQVALFGVYAIILQTSRGFLVEDNISEFLRKNFTLERGLIIGVTVLCLGAIALGIVIFIFLKFAYNMPYVHVPLTKAAIASIFIALLGIQIVFSSFYISIFNLTKTLDQF